MAEVAAIAKQRPLAEIAAYEWKIRKLEIQTSVRPNAQKRGK